VLIHDDEYVKLLRSTILYIYIYVENSMRTMVDGDDIRVAFSKDLQREPLSL